MKLRLMQRVTVSLDSMAGGYAIQGVVVELLPRGSKKDKRPLVRLSGMAYFVPESACLPVQV